MAVEVTRAAPVAPKPPVDPGVQLPPGVRRQVARAEEAQRQLQPISGEDNPPTPDSAPSAEPPTPALPTAGAQPAPTADPPEPSPQPNESQEDYEQRLRSLEGRYRVDMERSAQRVMQLERELAARAVPTPSSQPETPLLTPEEIADYGPDFVNLVERVAQQTQRPLLSQITTLQSQLEATGRSMAVSANDRMHQFMNQAIPGWSEINNHPDFIAWSRLPDVYSGAIRQGLMQDAWNKGDGPRVEAFFRGFLAEQGVSVPQSQPVPPAASHQPQAPHTNGASAGQPQPRVTLESLAAPGRARSAPPTPADKPVYTQQQILKFYTDVATGRFHGSEADRLAIDADIIAAQHEGRIIVDNRLASQPPAGFTR